MQNDKKRTPIWAYVVISILIIGYGALFLAAARVCGIMPTFFGLGTLILIMLITLYDWWTAVLMLNTCSKLLGGLVCLSLGAILILACKQSEADRHSYVIWQVWLFNVPSIMVALLFFQAGVTFLTSSLIGFPKTEVDETAPLEEREYAFNRLREQLQDYRCEYLLLKCFLVPATLLFSIGLAFASFLTEGVWTFAPIVCVASFGLSFLLIVVLDQRYILAKPVVDRVEGALTKAIIEGAISKGRPFALYLRDFQPESESDQYKLNGALYVADETDHHKFQTTLEANLIGQVRCILPVFSFRNQNDCNPEPQTYRIDATEEEWQTLFERYAQHATLLLVDLEYLGRWSTYEIDVIARQKLGHRAIVVATRDAIRALHHVNPGILENFRCVIERPGRHSGSEAAESVRLPDTLLRTLVQDQVHKADCKV